MRVALVASRAAIQAGSKWTRDELDAVVTTTAKEVSPQEIFLLEYLPDNGTCARGDACS